MAIQDIWYGMRRLGGRTVLGLVEYWCWRSLAVNFIFRCVFLPPSLFLFSCFLKRYIRIFSLLVFLSSFSLFFMYSQLPRDRRSHVHGNDINKTSKNTDFYPPFSVFSFSFAERHSCPGSPRVR